MSAVILRANTREDVRLAILEEIKNEAKRYDTKAHNATTFYQWHEHYMARIALENLAAFVQSIQIIDSPSEGPGHTFDTYEPGR